MDASHFMKSLFALRGYFVAIAAAGERGACFEQLQDLGRQAESRMLAATDGVNTHRGAIFCLGLLAASAAWRQQKGLALPGPALAETIHTLWGDGIALAGAQSSDSHGSRAVRRYGARGARGEALDGFPTLMSVAAPALRHGLSQFGDRERAHLHCLFASMAALEDTNLLHRGGVEGLRFVQREATAFLAAGGFAQNGWRPAVLDMHRGFSVRRLSPGGSADLLAAALFLQDLAP
jgi:triphosphoribosyl-dephospho-CoA synthase